ncbi:MAG: FG-GAP-like repeat-containing protein, partial [Fimbriiglobus sp.]
MSQKPIRRPTRLNIEHLEDRVVPTLTSWLGATGDWDTASQWSAGVPTAADDAEIVTPGSYGVTLNRSVNLNGSKLGGASGTQSLSLQGHSLSAQNTIDVGSFGKVQLGGGKLQARGAANFADPTAQTVSFADKLFTADFNQDGKLDAVVTDSLNSTISILINDGNGAFTSTDRGVSGRPEYVTSGDINGDGKLDIVTAGFGSISILLGNGDGTFGFSGLGIGSFPVTGLAIADSDLDGRPEVYISNGSSSKLTKVTRDQFGFYDVSQIETGLDTFDSLMAVDVNTDSKLDLVATTYSGKLATMQSQGNGSFTNASYTAGTNLLKVSGGDVNGDGKLDLVTLDEGSIDLGTPAQLGVFVGQGNGAFSAPRNLVLGAYVFPSGLAVADLNDDGRDDIATGTAVGVTLFENLGDNLFAQRSLGKGIQADLAIGHVDGDGLPDLLTRNAGDTSLESWKNQHQAGTISNAGQLLGPGTIDGRFSQTGVIELHGQSATSYDKLTFTEAANLGGELRVVLENGFSPADGTTWNLLSGPLSGTFSKVNLVNLPNGLTATPTYSANGLSLTFQSTGNPGNAGPLVAAFEAGYNNLRAELPDLAARVQGDGSILPTMPAAFTSQLQAALTGLLQSVDFTAANNSSNGLFTVLNNAGFTDVSVAADGTSAMATRSVNLPAFSGEASNYSLPFLPEIPGTLSWTTTGAKVTLRLGVDAAGFYVLTSNGLNVQPSLTFNADAQALVGGQLQLTSSSGSFAPTYRITLPDANSDGTARFGSEYTTDLAAGAKTSTTGSLNDMSLTTNATVSVPGVRPKNNSYATKVSGDAILPMSGTITRGQGWAVSFTAATDLLTFDLFQLQSFALGITGNFASLAAITVTADGSMAINPDGATNGSIVVNLGGALYQEGFSVTGSVTIDRTFQLGGLGLELDNTTLQATFGLANWADPQVNANLSLSSSFAAITYTNATTKKVTEIASISGANGYLDSTGRFKFTANSAALNVGDLLKFNVSGLIIEAGPNLPADTKVFSLASASASLDFLTPALGGAPVAALKNLTFRAGGQFSLGEVSVTMPAGYTSRLGVAEFLPFELQSVALTFPNSEAGSFDAFGLSIRGQFNVTEMANTFGFTPIISVGNTAVNGDVFAAINITSAKAGKIQFQEFGPIRVGFAGLEVGAATLSGAITLGGIQGGVLQPWAEFAVSIQSSVELGGFTDAGGLSVNSFSLYAKGDYDMSQAGFVTLNLKTNVQIGLKAKLADIFELEGIGFRSSMSLTTSTSQFDPTFKLSLDGINVNKVSLGFGDYVRLSAENVVFNFTKEANLPLATIGKASLSFGIPQDDLTALGITGSIENLEITQSGFPRLNGLGVNLAFTGFANSEAFSWFPVRVDQLGLKLGDMFTTDGNGVPTGVNDLTAFTLTFSGGFDGSKANLPLVATIKDVGLNVGKLSRGEFPIENLAGISFGVAPFKIGPVSIAGMFTFGTITTKAMETIYYGRVTGEFSYDGLGAGIDVVISDRGPVLATLSVPIGLPLDPFGLTLLSGVSGSLAFGAIEINQPTRAEDIGNLKAPTDKISDGAIEAILDTIPEGSFTWDKSIAISLKGTVITPYAPGIISGDLTVGAYLGTQFTTAAGGLKFFATGNLNVLGMSFASVKLLADFGKLLEPVFAGIIQVPDPSNPIGFLFPAKATAGAFFSFKGVVPTYLAAVGAFIDTVAKGTASVADDFFKDSLDLVVTRLKQDLERPLSKLVFDVNNDGVVSVAEGNFPDSELRTFFLDRLIVLIPSAERLVQNDASEAELTKGLKLATAFVNEILYTAGQIFQGQGIQVLGDLASLDQSFSASVRGLFTSDSQRAMLAFSKVMKDAADAATTTFINQLMTNFDPQMLLTAKIQPVIFGMPIGQSPLDGEISLSKKSLGVNLTLNVPVRALVTFPLSSILGPYAVTALPIPELIFNGTFGLTLPFGNTLADFLINGIPPIDPNAGDWTGLIEGGLSYGPYKLGKTGMLLFPKNWAFLDTKVQQVYGINANATAAVDRIQVGSEEHYNSLRDYGGVLGYSQLYLPEFITDPASAFSGIGLPTDFQSFLDWASSVRDALTSQVEVARTQFFIPSLSSVLQFNLIDFDALVANPGDPAGLKPKIGLRDGKTKEDVRDVLDKGYFEGLFKGKLLGIDFAQARIEADLNHLLVRGNIDWLGNASALFSLSSRKETITVDGTPREANVAMVAAEFNFDNSVNVRNAMQSWGLNPNLIPLATTTAIKFRAYSPGFDPKSPDFLKRTGGLEIEANLGINGIVQNARFKFRITPPGKNETLPKFSAKASVTGLSLLNIPGGIFLDTADIEILNTDAAGNLLPNAQIRIKISGKGRIFNQAIDYSGELNSDLTGFLTATLTGNSRALNLVDGFSLTGSFRIDLTKPGTTLRASLAFNGRLQTPSWLGTGTLNATGSIQPNGSLNLNLSTNSFRIGGFELKSQAGAPLLSISRGPTNSSTNNPLQLTVNGTVTVGLSNSQQSLSISGALNSSTGGSLAVRFTASGLNFGGLTVTGSAKLNIALSNRQISSVELGV